MPRVTRRVLLSLAAMIAVLLPGAPAWAHNALAEASPDKNATVKKAPAEVKLRFLQKLNPDHTTITVSNAGKQAVPTSDPEVKGTTGTVTFTEPLAGGDYTVAYQVVSTDGHTVKGSYQFTVAGAPATSPAASSVPAVSSPSPSPPVVPVAAAPASSSSLSNASVIALVAGIAVVLAGLAGFLYTRRRKA